MPWPRGEWLGFAAGLSSRFKEHRRETSGRTGLYLGFPKIAGRASGGFKGFKRAARGRELE